MNGAIRNINDIRDIEQYIEKEYGFAGVVVLNYIAMENVK